MKAIGTHDCTAIISPAIEDTNNFSAKQFWGRHLWARGYFAASSGNVTDEVIAQYIELQSVEERDRDGDFTIT